MYEMKAKTWNSQQSKMRKTCLSKFYNNKYIFIFEVFLILLQFFNENNFLMYILSPPFLLVQKMHTRMEGWPSCI